MRSRLFLFLSLFLLFSTILIIGIIKARNFYSSCHNPHNLQTCLTTIKPYIPLITRVNSFVRHNTLTQALDLYGQLFDFQPHLNQFLGFDQPFSILILLQNDTELRANGGFFGSYALVTLNQAKPTLRFQDIYVPDGQLKGHVDPPLPIQQAFHQGGLRLRDSDWDPNFLKSATAIRWFFDKGGETKPDLLMTLSLSTVRKIIDLTGPLKIDQYNLTLTPENLFTLLQSKVEADFFPGSTQKKDVLTATGRAFYNKLLALPLSDQLKVVNLLLGDANHQNLLFNATDSSLQDLFINKNWAGQLKPPQCSSPSCLLDSYLLVESNLGANKANCCLTRQTTHTITYDQHLNHQVKLEITNNSKSNPTPPDFYGGDYISYLRFYIPYSATNINISAKPTIDSIFNYPSPLTVTKQADITSYDQFTQIGFFHFTAHQTTSEATISYDLPQSASSDYELQLLKQHGLFSSPSVINFNGKSTITPLDNDFVFKANLYSL